MEKISSSRLNETIDGEVRPSFMSSSLSSPLSKPYDRHHQHDYLLQASELGELGIQDWARLWVQVVWTFCFTIRTLVFTYFTLNMPFFHISLLIHCSGFRGDCTYTNTHTQVIHELRNGLKLKKTDYTRYKSGLSSPSSSSSSPSSSSWSLWSGHRLNLNSPPTRFWWMTFEVGGTSSTR